jgi:hypothetical protein
MIAPVDRRALDGFVFEMRRASRLRRDEWARHGEVDGVDRDSWEHPDLVQIWFRWADYVVPRADVGIFTLGAMPRRRRWADALEALADAVGDAVNGERTVSRDVHARLPDLPIRSACLSGRVHIRWDTLVVEVLVAERPVIAPGDPVLHVPDPTPATDPAPARRWDHQPSGEQPHRAGGRRRRRRRIVGPREGSRDGPAVVRRGPCPPRPHRGRGAPWHARSTSRSRSA